MNFKKFKDHLLDLNFLSKELGYKIFTRKYSANLRLKILSKPKSGRILVIAPHPDDEIFACGGVLAKHQKQKDRIKIVYLTGEGERKNEAERANQILGISDLVFLGFKDNELVSGQIEIRKLAKIIAHFKPNIIYAPSGLDSHPDHRAAAEILLNVIKKNGFAGEIWSYEIWTPIFANRIIKIDDVFKLKLRAIASYQSQLQERGYLRAIVGLNSYRAEMFKAGKKAEAYFVARADLYKKNFSK